MTKRGRLRKLLERVDAFFDRLDASGHLSEEYSMGNGAALFCILMFAIIFLIQSVLPCQKNQAETPEQMIERVDKAVNR